MAVYDLCVVGAGMIGSAAARHASQDRSVKVCLIGPEEPQEKRIETGNEVFGCHYDEARITRGADSRTVWGILAQRSIKRYRKLEELSGIRFYHEVGSVMIGSKDGNYVEKIQQNARKSGISDQLSFLSSREMRSKFPYMYFGDNDMGIYESTDSGYINPRKMVMAQIIVACNQGCDVIRDVVVEIRCSADPKWSTSVNKVITQKGHMVLAKKVLLATNVFTGLHNLLNDIEPVFEPTPQTVTLVQVSEKDAEKMSNMPVVMYKGYGGDTWYKEYPRNPDGNVNFYLLPPVKYPDGKYYLKLGHSDAILTYKLRMEDIRKWYCSSGDKVLENQMFNLLQGVFHGTNFISHHGEACVTMVTPTFHPYVDLISPSFGVALGGNGWAAKSSEELGKVAADMIRHSKWTYDLPCQHFKMEVKNASSKL